MEHVMLALLIVTTGILYWIWQNIGNEGGKKLPPGPYRLPVFGNFFNKVLLCTHFFDVPALNIVWAYITGTRYQHDDPQVHKLVEGITEANNALGFDGGILNAFPFLSKILPPAMLGLRHVDEIMGIFRSKMEQLIADYRLKGRYKSEPENFVEQYLQHIDLAQAGEIPDPDNIFNDQNLVCILYDLFWAGSDTTSSTVSYAILWLTINQEAQTKLRKELKDFIAQNNRVPTINDRPHLPYTRATILEVHRRSYIVAIGARKVYIETAFEDYVIPKNTIVMINYYSLMMEEKHWGDPHNFRPERFLDSENQIINSEHVIPFGLGKRACMGETVAETSVFLFLTFLFSRYEFHPTTDKYNTDPIFGIVQAPHPYTVKMKFAK